MNYKKKVESLDPKKPSFVKNANMKRDQSLAERKKKSKTKQKGKNV